MMFAKNKDKVIATIPKFICRLNHPNKIRIITRKILNKTSIKRIAYNSIIESLSSAIFFSYLPVTMDENTEMAIARRIDTSMLIPMP